MQSPDILRPIFTHLDDHSLAQCVRVNSTFHNLATSTLYYKLIIRDDPWHRIFHGLDVEQSEQDTRLSSRSRRSKAQILAHTRVLEIRSHMHTPRTESNLKLDLLPSFLRNLKMVRIQYDPTPGCFCQTRRSSLSEDDLGVITDPSLVDFLNAVDALPSPSSYTPPIDDVQGCTFLSDLRAEHFVVDLLDSGRTDQSANPRHVEPICSPLEHLLQSSKIHTFLIPDTPNAVNHYDLPHGLLVHSQDKEVRAIIGLPSVTHIQWMEWEPWSEFIFQREIEHLFRVLKGSKCSLGKVFYVGDSGLVDLYGKGVPTFQVEHIANGINEKAEVGGDGDGPGVGNGNRNGKQCGMTLRSKADYLVDAIVDEVEDGLLRQWEADIMLETLD